MPIDFNFDVGSLMPNFGGIPVVEILGVVLGAVLVFVWYFWRHRTFIFEYDSDGHRRLKKVEWTREKMDRHKRKFLDFILARKRIPNNYRPFSHGNKKIYMLMEDNKGFYHDIGFNKDSVGDIEEVKAIPSDVLTMQISMLNEIATDYQTRTWWDKWGQFVLPVVLVVIIAFMFIYGIERIGEFNSQSAGLLQRAIEIHETTVIAK